MTTSSDPASSRQVRRALERRAAKSAVVPRRIRMALPPAGSVRMPASGPSITPGKGLFDGNCNRTDCQAPIEGANWFNTSTRKYYCGHCADLINHDALRFDGVTILVPVDDPDYRPPFPYERMRAHREARERFRARPA